MAALEARQELHSQEGTAANCLAGARARALTRIFFFLSDTYTPKQLAAAGFFYKGKGESAEDTLTECFMCHKELEGWETKDVPLDEHRARSPNCPLLNLQLQENRLRTFTANHWPAANFTATALDVCLFFSLFCLKKY